MGGGIPPPYFYKINLHYMEYLTLDLIKKQCIIDACFIDDDSYLEHLGTVAEQMIEQEVDMPLEEIAANNDGELPMPLMHAALMYVDYLYGAERGSSTQEIQIPPAIIRFCQMYRRFK